MFLILGNFNLFEFSAAILEKGLLSIYSELEMVSVVEDGGSKMADN